MQTDLLFYKNSNLKNFKSSVISISEKGIVLDKTYFYPQGGHQQSDIGTISFNGNTVNVLKVLKDSNFVYHKTEEINLNEGDIVDCVVDLERRNYLSHLHSTQHIVSKILSDKHNIETTSALFSDNGGYIVFDTNVEHLSIENLNKDFMDIVKRNIPIERVEKGKFFFNVNIGGVFDMECGGTHAISTGKLKDISFFYFEKNKLFYDFGNKRTSLFSDFNNQIISLCRLLDISVDKILKTTILYESIQRIINSLSKEKELTFDLANFILKKDIEENHSIVSEREKYKFCITNNLPLPAKLAKSAISRLSSEYDFDIIILFCKNDSCLVFSVNEEINLKFALSKFKKESGISFSRKNNIYELNLKDNNRRSIDNLIKVIDDVNHT